MQPSDIELSPNAFRKERALDEAPVGIVITNPTLPDNPIIYANKTFERLTGYDAAEILGKNCRFLQGPETDPNSVKRIREAVNDGEPIQVELRNYRRNGSLFWNEVTIAPIRTENGAISHFVGFQQDVSDRKAAQEAASQRAEELERLLDRISGLMYDVTEILMHAQSRADSEQRVCDRIAETDNYEFVWFGEYDPVNENIRPSTTAGSPHELDNVTYDIDGATPATSAILEERTIIADADTDPVCKDIATDATAVISIPIQFDTRIYGVLTIYSTTSNAFDELEQIVLKTLGRTISTAINAAASRQMLTADNLVELEFELWDEDVFVVPLSEKLNCGLTYTGSVTQEDNAVTLYFTADRHLESTENSTLPSQIDTLRVVNTGRDFSLVALDLPGESIVSNLADMGIRTKALTANTGKARLTLEMAGIDDPKRVANIISERYSGSHLIRYHEYERPPKTKPEFISEVSDLLSDRQQLAIELAFENGYYDSNRKVSGKELAEIMGVSRPTFHQHRRVAERKLLAAFLNY